MFRPSRIFVAFVYFWDRETLRCLSLLSKQILLAAAHHLHAYRKRDSQQMPHIIAFILYAV